MVGSLNDIIIYNTFREEAQLVQNDVVSGSVFSRTMSLLKQEFPDATEEKSISILTRSFRNHTARMAGSAI